MPGEGVEDRVEDVGVGRGGHAQPAERHVPAGEFGFEPGHRVRLAGDRAGRGAVHGGQRQVRAEQRGEGLRGGRDADGRPAARADEPDALGDHRQHLVEVHHAGQTGGRVLAQGVPDQRVGAHALLHERPGQRVLGDDQREEGGGAARFDLLEQGGAQVPADDRPQDARTSVHGVLVDVVVPVQLGAHAGVLAWR